MCKIAGMGLSGTTLVVMAVVVAGIAITVSLGLTSYYADHTGKSSFVLITFHILYVI